jgi:hypothetical protein
MPYGRHREDTGPYDLPLFREFAEYKKRTSPSRLTSSYRSLLPNIQWLQLPSARHASFVPTLLFTEHLKSLSLPWTNLIHDHDPSFRAILACVPNIESLDLGTGKGLPPQECPDLSDSICRLRLLRRLATGSHFLDARSILHLASLPYLQSLQIANTAYHVLQSLVTLSSPPFVALQCLEMNALSLDSWPAFLERLRPPQLRTIKLDCSSLPSSSEDIYEFFLALSDSLSQPYMHSVHLNSVSSLAGKIASKVVVDFWILAPLLVFENLTKLEFTLACSFSFEDQDIVTMAASWPRLQHLQLGSAFGWGQQSGVTLQGVLALVKACRDLEHLGLSLDASSLPALTASELELDTAPLNAQVCARTSSVNTKITYIHVGDSNIEDACAVANFLYPIFPNLRGIGGVWLYLRAGAFTHQERECHALWQDVASFIREARNRVRLKMPASSSLKSGGGNGGGRSPMVTTNS